MHFSPDVPSSPDTPTLFVVATPIGNLGDLSPRAREVLASVSLVLCEDTRHTAKLMSHAGLHVPLESLHEHNEREKSQAVATRIATLRPPCAALVSDAGTPAISDPGAHLVRAAREAGLRIVSVPGPCALACALAASGFAAPRHVFSAFLPRDAKGQREEFARWQAVAPCLGVFYESPQRVRETLHNLEDHFGSGVEISISREISKIHEEHMTGPLQEVMRLLEGRERPQGEFVISVLVDSAVEPRRKLTFEEALDETLTRARAGERLKDVVKEVASHNGLDAKDLYRAAVNERQSP